MAWIKTQEGDLQAIGSMIIAYRNGNSIYCGTNFLGSYKNHEAAIQVREGFHRWLDRHGYGVFTMPGNDFMKRFEPIDVEKAAESIRRTEAAMKFVQDHRRQAAEMVTTFPIDDEIRCFEFKSHNRKKVHSVSFDEHTDLVTVVFYDPGPESG